MRPSRRSLLLLLARLDEESRPATPGERDAVAALAAQLPKRSLSAAGTEVEGVRGPWLPRFRSPDRLWPLYETLNAGSADTVPTAAMADLAHLALPFDMSEAEFNEAVLERLRLEAVMEELVAFLARPRRFGEITEFVGRFCSGGRSAERQSTAQTLIRWITHFDAETFVLDMPGYSEILSLRATGPS